VGYNAKPSLVDIDGDGDLDLFIGESGEGSRILFFRNTAAADSTDPAYAAPSINPFGIENVGSNAKPSLVDIDGDGDLDIFIGINTGCNLSSILFFHNTAAAGSTDPAYDAPSTNPFGLGDVGGYASPSFVDIDGDGDLDAFIGEYYGNTLFFRNTAPIITAAAVTAIADDVGIFQGTVASGATTDDSSLAISGTLSAALAAGDTVRIYDGSEFLGNATVSEDGTTWSYADSRTLSDNQIVSYTAQVADAAGNQSAAGSAYIATVDTAAPNAGTLSLADYTDSGASSADFISTDNSFDLTLSDQEDGASVDYQVSTDDGSNWSTTSTEQRNLSDGAYQFRAVVSDAAGNIFNTNTISLTVDTAAPSAPAFSLATDSGASNSDGVTNVGTVSVSGVEENATWEYSTDSGSSWTTGSDSSFTLAAGSYDIGAIRVRQTDLAGNTTVNPSQNDAVITVDLTAPTTTVAVTAITDNVGIFTGTVASGATTDDTSLSISGTLSAALAAGDTVRIYDRSEFLGNATVSEDGTTWSYADSRSLSDTQSVSYTARVADAAGNQSAAGSAYTATVDTSAPVPGTLNLTNFSDSGSSATDGITTDDSFSLALSGQEDGSTFVYQRSIDDGITWADTIASQINLANGSYQFRVQIIDAVGNRAYSNGQSVTVDTARPTGGQGSYATVPSYRAASTNVYGIADAGYFANPSFADIDGDGDLDLFVGERYGNTLFLRNTASLGASAPAYAAASTNPFGIADVGSNSSLALADIDADGDLDLFIGNFDGNTLFFRNTANPGATAPAYSPAQTNPFGIANGGAYASPALLDADGDGDLDLFIGNRNGNTLFFRNTAGLGATNPAYAAASTNPFGIGDVGDLASPSFADADADGDLDLFIGNQEGNTLFFRNTAIAGATAPAYAAASTNPFGISDVGFAAHLALADTDGDGDLDLFIGNSAGNTLFFANTAATPVAPVTSSTANGSYGIGAVINITVQFSEALVVDTTGGSPRLQLETGVIDRYATYSGGSGTNTLSFSYTVQAGDSSADLDQLSANALALNGGTIKDAAGNNASLSLAAPGASGSLAANGALVINTIGAITASIGAVADNVGLIQANLANDAATDDNTPTITGSISASLSSGQSLRLYNGSTLLGSASVNNTDRSWGFTPTTALANGFYAITARVADAAGNLAAASSAQRFSIDSTSNQLIGTATANTLTASGSKDLITGLGGIDTFKFTSLTTSTLASFDRITDFSIGTDILDGPTAVAAANINKLGAVSALNSTSISSLLTSTSFLANRAASFSYADPSGVSRSFIALNNGTAGYQSSTDAIIEITGYTGSLNDLQIM
jgi:hypothetical protein